jgi:hypothetical protein
VDRRTSRLVTTLALVGMLVVVAAVWLFTSVF